jgi:hypothetical protein
VCSLCLELVCLRHLFLLFNVALFNSFSSSFKILKKTKKSNIPQKEDGKFIFFLWKHNEFPLDKAHAFVCCQALGFNLTLGSCSLYIDLCPPPFGYPSKHMESLRCLLHRELMSMSCCLSHIICRAIFQGNFYPT